MSSDEKTIKIPSAKTLNKIRGLLVEDEEFRFMKIKLDRDKPRFHLPEPLDDDDENVEISPSFRAVVLVAKKNFYQSDEDKKEGKEIKEKRALYVLREGKFLPELVYCNPTSLRPWRELLAPIVQSGRQYFHVLVEFAAEKVSSKTTGFKWMKFTFKEVRSLTEGEIEYINDLREMVEGRVKDFKDDSQLADIEDQALGEPKPEPKEEVEEDDTRKHSAKAKAKIEADEDGDEEPKPKKKKAPIEEEEDLPSGKPKQPQLEEEEEEPKPKKRSTLDEDDDLNDLVNKKKSGETGGKKKTSLLDDDDD